MTLPYNQLAARALTQTGQNYSKQPQVPAARAVPKSTLDQALELAGRGFAWCIAREKEISAPFAKIPYPGMGAARILDFHAGLPHGHAHWPLPNVPLPSVGPLIPIPKISGADKTKIQDQWAARCGDFGLGIWCGGYMPMNEIFFGSASVWIESCRAARTLDITDHCILFDPSTCGVAKGAVVDSSDNVKIGGAPMPSLTQAAIAAAMKIAVKAVAKGGKAVARATASVAKKAFQKVIQLFRRVHRGVYKVEQRTVGRYMKAVKIFDDPAYRAALRERLEGVAKTAEGRRTMDEIVDSGKKVEHVPTSQLPIDRPDLAHLRGQPGAWVIADGPGAAIKTIDGPGGKYMRPARDAYGNTGYRATDMAGPGAGSGSKVYFDPSQPIPKRSRGGTLIGEHSPDTVLAHELSHARNNAKGVNKAQILSQDKAWNDRWKNLEEFEAVQAENAANKQKGTPLRDRYNP